MKNKNTLIILIFTLLLTSCQIQTVTKIQCNNGQVVDSIELCPQEVNSDLDCDACPPKIEMQETTVEKVVTRYYCANGEEVENKESCIDYIDTSWDLSENKGELIEKLNSIKDSLGFVNAVEITKLVVSGDSIEISYTQLGGEFQVESVGQTMFDVLKQTANYLQLKHKLDYNINIRATTSNGGYLFIKETTKSDILKILNYDFGMDEWINQIRKD